MPRDWETWLGNSTGPASADEEAKRDRTEERIRRAMRASQELPSSVKIVAKGSYANNTNVRLDSDVDIAVEWTDQFKVDVLGDGVGKSAAQLGYDPVDSMITAEDLRARVERALITAFGSSAVDTTGRTAIRVTAGTGTLDADVAPCFQLRRYDAPLRFREGQRLFRRGGGYIDNWPEQNKTNGNSKNVSTGRRYKSMVRALKRLENDMLSNRVISAPVPGYLIECLVWNVPNTSFGHTRLVAEARAILAEVFNSTMTDDGPCNDWGEVNELKYLFRPSQKWTRQEAHAFVDAAWDYMGFT